MKAPADRLPHCLEGARQMDSELHFGIIVMLVVRRNRDPGPASPC